MKENIKDFTKAFLLSVAIHVGLVCAFMPQLFRGFLSYIGF
jgi:hypothetical protein